MKTSDEMVRDLLARRDQYAAVQTKRRKVVLHSAAAFGCICLMMLVGIGVRRVRCGAASPEPIAKITVIPGRAEAETTPPTDREESAEKYALQQTRSSAAPTNTDRICLIETVEFPTAPQMAIALLGKDFIAMDDAALNTYYGVNVFPDVPDDLQPAEHASGIYRRNGGTGEVYWDSNVLSYRNADGTRGVSVNVDKGILPFDFCNLFAEVNTRSVIEQTEVGLAQHTDGTFLAEFTVRGVGFRIVANGLTAEELIELIRSLLA